MRNPARFRDDRWRRAGATDKQLAGLLAAHAALTPDEQTAEGRRIDSISSADLNAELTGPDLTGNIDEVLAKVSDDRELAAVALSLEQAKTRPRAGLVDKLNEIIGAAGDEDDA